MSFNNFTGDISVYGLSIKLGQPAISSNKQYIEIPYVGIASPASNTVSIIKYQYSLDNGVTYLNMTPMDSSDITNLSFNEDGNAIRFKWNAKADIGNDLYNKSINVILQASEFGLTSAEATRSVYLNRTTTDVAAERAKKVFPDTYGGIPGSVYMQNKLPKIK
jgi:hypothetical protein